LDDLLEEIVGLPRFGIEVFMNRQIIAQRLPVAVTRWPQVTQSRKTEKLGYWRGLRAEWRMITDLLKMEYPLFLVWQTCQLLVLRVGRRRPRGKAMNSVFALFGRLTATSGWQRFVSPAINGNSSGP
jgi:hypothetical protein